jgi:hypothetical protein
VREPDTTQAELPIEAPAQPAACRGRDLARIAPGRTSWAAAGAGATGSGRAGAALRPTASLPTPRGKNGRAAVAPSTRTICSSTIISSSPLP